MWKVAVGTTAVLVTASFAYQFAMVGNYNVAVERSWFLVIAVLAVVSALAFAHNA